MGRNMLHARACLIALGLLLSLCTEGFSQPERPAERPPERPAADTVDEVKAGRDLTSFDRQKERLKDRIDAYQKFLDVILKNQVTKKPDGNAQKTELLTTIAAARASIEAIAQQRRDNQPAPATSVSVLRNQMSDFSRKLTQNPYRDSLRTITTAIEKTFGEKLELISNADARQDLISTKSDIDDKSLPRFDSCKPPEGFPQDDSFLRSGFFVERLVADAGTARTFLDACEKGIRDTFDAYLSRVADDYNNFVDSTIKSLRDKITAVSSDQSKIDTQIAGLEKQLREDKAKRQDVERLRAETEAQRARVVIDPASKDTILLTLVAWGLIICVVIGAIVLLIRYQALDPQRKDFPYPIFMEMITVFLLTASILILGLAAKLNSEALAALIGAVSGYVLGKSKDGTKTT